MLAGLLNSMDKFIIVADVEGLPEPRYIKPDIMEPFFVLLYSPERALAYADRAAAEKGLARFEQKTKKYNSKITLHIQTRREAWANYETYAGAKLPEPRD